jgi:hypothetical protein
MELSMSLPKQRMTITLAEHRLLKPGLDVLANGLADTKSGHFPYRHPWHLIDSVASDVYRSQAYYDEMAARIICVRGKLWDLTQSRKISIDAFELLALALALRLSRSQKLVDATNATSAEIGLLQLKIELYRKRAKRSAIARIGRLEYQSAAEHWRRFVGWLRYNILYVNVPKRGESRPATLWREQRRQLTELINKSLAERFFEAPSDVEMVRIVTRSLRRGRHPVSLRDLLRAPQAPTDFLAGFVEKRVELKRLPGAPIPAWQAVSDRADRFKEYQERIRGKIVEPSNTNPDKIITEEQNHQITTPPKVKAPRRYTHKRQALTSEILVNAMAEWLYQNVTMKFDFTIGVCEQARFQIMHGLLDQYRVKTAATSFNSLMKELRPVEFSDDSGILISEIAGWLLGCLLATGQKRGWLYWAFGAAGDRAKRMQEKARDDEWAATLANRSQSASLHA